MMHKWTWVFAAGVLSVAAVAQTTVTRHVAPSLERPRVVLAASGEDFKPLFGFGVFNFGAIEMVSGSTFRSLSASVMSGSMESAVNTGRFYVGASDFSSSGGVTIGDIIGMRGTFSHAEPTTMEIYRQLAFTSAGNGGTAGSVRSYGIGSVSGEGWLGVRLDGGGNAGAMTDNAWALKRADDGATTNVVTDFANPTNPGSYTLLGSSPNRIQPPIVGFDNDLTLSATFNKELIAGRSDFNTGSAYGPRTQVLHDLNLDSRDNRGAFTYNSVAGMAAVLRVPPGATSDNYDRVAIYSIDVPGAGEPVVLKDAQGFPSNLGTELTTQVGGNRVFPINFFSNTSTAGPSQVAMNDNGDIALTVAFTTGANAEQTDAVPGTSNIRNATHRGIIYARYDRASQSYGPFRVVVDSSVNTEFKTVDPLITNANGLHIGPPALDNMGNVYFTAVFAVIQPDTGSPVVKNAIFKATANNTSDPTGWSVFPILRNEDRWTDPDTGELVTIIDLPAGQSGNNSHFPTPAGLGPQCINRVPLPCVDLGVLDPSDPFAIGGLVTEVGVLKTPAGGGSNVFERRVIVIVPTSPLGDATGDMIVDDADLTSVILDFGSTSVIDPNDPNYNPNYGLNGQTDVNRDGIIDDADITIVILNFGRFNGC